jgi:hypothetical protein
MISPTKFVTEEKKRLKQERHQEVQTHMRDVRHRFLTVWQTDSHTNPNAHLSKSKDDDKQKNCVFEFNDLD